MVWVGARFVRTSVFERAETAATFTSNTIDNRNLVSTWRWICIEKKKINKYTHTFTIFMRIISCTRVHEFMTPPMTYTYMYTRMTILLLLLLQYTNIIRPRLYLMSTYIGDLNTENISEEKNVRTRRGFLENGK